MMKKYFRMISPALLLILLGGFLIGYPLYGTLMTQAAVENFNKKWETQRAAQALPDTETGFTPAPVAAKEETAGLKTRSEKDSTKASAVPATGSPKKNSPPAIGRIIIPQIALSAPIAEGVAMETLRYAVGHIQGTAALGSQGNTALAGHRSYTYGEFFNRLDEVKVGDIIKIETLKQNFTYKVNDIKVVEPTNLSVLDDTSPTSILTLITCTPENSSRYRLIVSAEIIQ
jgi:sortase A